MSNAIANAFYDKQISKLNNEISYDNEGGITKKATTIASNFKGNVSFSNCKKIQEEYGLDYDIDIAITTFVDTNIAINDVIKYKDVIYIVSDVLKSDSHSLIVAKKWQK